MTHPDPELLTQIALNDPLALDADVLAHIADCPQCSAEVASLQRVVAAADGLRVEPSMREVVVAPNRVWDRIALGAGISGPSEGLAVREADSGVPEQAESGGDWLFGEVTTNEADVSESDVSESDVFESVIGDGDGDRDGSDAPLEIVGAHRAAGARAPRRLSAQLVAAAVIGILVGALFTWALTGRDDGSGDGGGSDPGSGGGSVYTTSDLVGVDGHTTTGVASFVETATGGEVTIKLRPEDVGEGFIQAWLLDEDTGGMVALGVIDDDKGTFAVPKELDLSAFNQIDISLEPYDGNPEHSAVSLARGPLP